MIGGAGRIQNGAAVQKEIQRASEKVSSERADGFVAVASSIFDTLRASYVSARGATVAVAQIGEVYTHAAKRDGEQILVSFERVGGEVVLRTAMPDQPFIVDTIHLFLRRIGARTVAGFNVVIDVLRDEAGLLAGVSTEQGKAESFVRMEVLGLRDEDLPSLQAALLDKLRCAQVMVTDFREMAMSVERVAEQFARLAEQGGEHADDYLETSAFLRWLLWDNFVMLGMVSGDVRLGADREGFTHAAQIAESDWPALGPLPVLVRKGPSESPVHRNGRVDEVFVNGPEVDGAPGERLLIRGLFTYRALNQPSRDVPILRRRLQRLRDSDGARPRSYRYKAISNVFDSLGTEFLFTATQEDVNRAMQEILSAVQDQRVRFHLVKVRDTDTAFAFVSMPKSLYAESVRQEVQRELVRASGATYVDHGLYVGRYDTVLLNYFLTGTSEIDPTLLDGVQARIFELCSPWAERVYPGLAERYGDERAGELTLRYRNAFTRGYVQHTQTDRALRDLDMLEALAEDRPVVADIFPGRLGRLNLRLYQRDKLLLSDLVPVLDHFGLVVARQFSTRVKPSDRAEYAVDTLLLKGAWGMEDADVLAGQEVLSEAIEAVFAGKVTDSPLNRLVLRAHLRWSEVDIMRTFIGFARQIGLRQTQSKVRDILLLRPLLAKRFVDCFHARFDPDLIGDRGTVWAEAKTAYEDALSEVTTLDEDRVFRALFNLLEASLRTNYYRTDRVQPYISVKIDHDLMRDLPAPKLKYEIYVYHRDVEGVHLRGGKIARGGIRWSDRSDYRTEVLGLVTTQMVKNVLIVPVGAKGGFYLKAASTDPFMRRREADDLYQVYIRGLLDVTDNIVDGKVVRPPRVVAWDDDDPYLVVAADKGTAHLSDTANGVSAAYDFWLGDAFASGGSNGYDHKACGITARGAWVCVRRHFKEMGLDPNREAFTAIGIGDCGGDVFGNGVIEHERMQLVAAFNHRHIFFDPDPNIAASYAERKRLFEAVKGWDHYDTSLISEGGGVFERSAKSIPLSPQMQKHLGVLADSLPPNAVIRMLLRMSVDLLWNGGIGTYVKASTETHADAGDPTNDECRVDATELRCRVVGEGGNLGLTQNARIEYALAGGRISTDAVDNSGGVDMSDHEVNLKVLFGKAEARGELKREDRNELLARLTDQVAGFVLDNNDLHGRQLSLDALRSAVDTIAFSHTIHWVTQAKNTTEATLNLPVFETLIARSQAGGALTRPELAVLGANVKMIVYDQMLDCDSSAIPGFEDRVRAYFPQEVADTYASDIDTHMLHKSIGMTVALTDVMACAGAGFYPRMLELTGANAAEVTGAYLKALDLVDAPSLLKTLANTTESVDGAYRGWMVVHTALEHLVAAWLAPGGTGAQGESSERILEIVGDFPRLRGTAQTRFVTNSADILVAAGLRANLARQVTNMQALPIAREIALMLEEQPDSNRNGIVRYLSVGEASGLLPLLRALSERPSATRWDSIAFGILRNRLLQRLRRLALETEIGSEMRLGVDRLSSKLSRGALKVLSEELEGLASHPDLANVIVANERVRALLEG